jgi:hypothetical protein
MEAAKTISGRCQDIQDIGLPPEQLWIAALSAI